MYNKALNVCSLGKQLVFVFPRVSMFPSTSSRETLGKTKLFPSGPDIKCITIKRHLFRPLRYDNYNDNDNDNALYCGLRNRGKENAKLCQHRGAGLLLQVAGLAASL